jgi:hypothetical protein
VFVPTVPELATDTVNVVLVAPTEIAVIKASVPTLVPEIASPTSARPPNAAFAATIVNAPEAPLTAEAVASAVRAPPEIELVMRGVSMKRTPSHAPSSPARSGPTFWYSCGVRQMLFPVSVRRSCETSGWMYETYIPPRGTTFAARNLVTA